MALAWFLVAFVSILNAVFGVFFFFFSMSASTFFLFPLTLTRFSSGVRPSARLFHSFSVLVSNATRLLFLLALRFDIQKYLSGRKQIGNQILGKLYFRALYTLNGIFNLLFRPGYNVCNFGLEVVVDSIPPPPPFFFSIYRTWHQTMHLLFNHRESVFNPCAVTESVWDLTATLLEQAVLWSNRQINICRSFVHSFLRATAL